MANNKEVNNLNFKAALYLDNKTIANILKNTWPKAPIWIKTTGTEEKKNTKRKNNI